MANNRLPFDVLGHVFSHYPDEETIHHPLETLLLVCHAWHGAALGHRALWGNLNIFLGHSPTSNIWKKRLPLRLARAGPTTPLHISLFNVLDMDRMKEIAAPFKKDPLYSDLDCTNPYPVGWPLCEDLCPCYKDARECAEFALECLKGTDGEFCSRWKKFHVDLGYKDGYDASRILAMAFCYPTPSLTSLHIENLILDEEYADSAVFNEIPRLQELVVKDCYLHKSLNLQALIDVDLDAGSSNALGGFSDLRSACQLKSICIQYFQPGLETVLLPKRLPNLTSLEIEGLSFSLDSYPCEMPNLSTMTLSFEDEVPISDILECVGINLEKLETLTIVWGLGDLAGWDADKCGELFDSLAELLNRSPNLSCVTGNWSIHNLLVKILWDSWSDHGTDGILGSKNFILHLIVNARPSDITGRQTIEINAEDSLETLKKLAGDWELFSPEPPVEEFLYLFMKCEDEDEDEDEDGSGNENEDEEQENA